MSATVKIHPASYQTPADLESCFSVLELAGKTDRLDQLPFSDNDISAGTETELQAVVIGNKDNVDLPREIERSRFFTNLQRRTQSGDAPEKLLSELREFLSDPDHSVWENSWVRFPSRCLSLAAQKVLEKDLLAVKNAPQQGKRSDVERFRFTSSKGEDRVRVPVSYLVKLALADHLGNQKTLEPLLRQVGESLLENYTSDNTSPETFSFHVEAPTAKRGLGRTIAGETAKRFLFTQLLVHYANQQFGLKESGQQAMIYFAPHPPQQQKTLNNLIPDAFYRQLFMSPCLSGWNCGQQKQTYMELCHQVLSRSQLNAVAKLREAGIIINNLVVLPNMSNTSLANNGVHISLGSHKLTQACQEQMNGYNPAHEKFLGDLATKIMEHFLPLFVTTYSAAPYRLAFEDFHPEKALGFLPHQLDFTHLRMLWRRWKKKSSLSVFGHALTPFGPDWLDRGLRRTFGLRGDLVPDFRLIDYPVCFLSTDQSPAYNGRLGNQEQLKDDLSDMGIFDRQMSLYQFFKQRSFREMGYSGFEGRFHSLFPHLVDDMAAATNLQILITALAFKYMAEGKVRHRHIPDTPFVESERRQVFFDMAIGIPTFFVKRNTRNRFLLKIIKKTDRIRTSHRYPGYLRIYKHEYCRALISILREDAADLIDMFGLHSLIEDLERKLNDPSHSAAAQLVRNISGRGMNASRAINASDFNRSAENYYRNGLRKNHLQQSLNLLWDDLQQIENGESSIDRDLRPLMADIMSGNSLTTYQASFETDLLSDQLGVQPLKRLINLMLLAEERDRRKAEQTFSTYRTIREYNASVHQSQYQTGL